MGDVLRGKRGRFLPGTAPGPGRTKWAVATESYRELVHKATPGLIKILIEKAYEGELGALKMILDRSFPAQSAAFQELQHQLDELKAELAEMRAKRAA